MGVSFPQGGACQKSSREFKGQGLSAQMGVPESCRRAEGKQSAWSQEPERGPVGNVGGPHFYAFAPRGASSGTKALVQGLRVGNSADSKGLKLHESG